MSDNMSMPSLLSGQYQAALPRQQDFSMQQMAMASRQAEITMTTSEGDRVTISSSLENMQGMQYQAAGAGPSHSFVAASLNTASFAMTVEGDLNAQELADISSLVKDLSHIAKDFFKGNLDQAMNKALDIGDTGTINGFAASFTATSMTSSLLSANHPIPALAPESMGSDAGNEAEASTVPAQPDMPDMIDLLRGQWEQLKELLAQQTAPASATQATAQEIPDTPVMAASPGVTAQNMMDRATTTMSEYPRLSPLIQPLVARVIDNLAASMPKFPDVLGLTNQLHSEFARAWHQWLIAA